MNFFPFQGSQQISFGFQRTYIFSKVKDKRLPLKPLPLRSNTVIDRPLWILKAANLTIWSTLSTHLQADIKACWY